VERLHMLEADYKATLERLQISMQQAEQQSALQVRAHAFTVPCSATRQDTMYV